MTDGDLRRWQASFYCLFSIVCSLAGMHLAAAILVGLAVLCITLFYPKQEDN